MTKDINLTNEEFEKLLNNYEYKFQKGDIVKGTVTAYVPDGALIYIGAKNDALVPTREALLDSKLSIQDTLQKNTEYEFLIIKEEDEDCRFLLSYKKVAHAYVWKELETLKANDETVVGKVVSIVKGGVLVEVGGIRGFVPSSHLRIRENDLAIDSEIELKILTLDAAGNNFILSNKKTFGAAHEQTKKASFEQLHIGQRIEGEIVRITDFGAFVDVNGIDGLLPLSQISWKWVEHPSDMLKVGQKILVEIISMDSSKLRVSLSLKTLEADPWINIENQLQEGKNLEGKVTRLKHFGAFVEILEGIEAFLPMSEITEYQNAKSCIVEVGDVLMTTVAKFNIQDRRISLAVLRD